MKGSCLCGTVIYEVDRLAGPIGHCRCKTCRKAHAAAFASTARVDRTHFRWLSGEATVRAFESSPGKLRHFCSNCGTHLVAEWVAQPQVILRVATFNEDPGVRPKANIWVSHQVPWLAQGADLLSFSEAPPATP
ncbi:MAG TPA: GFA family protein [Burkholderiaceae bacterium]|nr:GFA family protein [Burkholderiaceae bacterium]